MAWQVVSPKKGIEMTTGHDPASFEPAKIAPAVAAVDALHRAELLDTDAEDRFDRITGLVRDVLGVPVCLVSLVDNSRQFFKSASGLAEPWASRRETPLSHSFCKHVVASRAPLIVTNSETDPRVINNLAIRDIGIAAYLGVPLHSEGVVIGSLCAIDVQPRLWKTSEVERLTAFAAIVDEQIQTRHLMRERDAALKNAELLAHEHSHRIKNSLAVAASMVSISAAEAETVQDLARIARDRIMAMAKAQNLVWLREGGGELKDLLGAILGAYRMEGDSMIRIDGAPVTLPFEKVTPISLIFHELATNASKYGSLRAPGGAVDLGWKADGERLSIRWTERPSEAASGEPAQADGAVPQAIGFGTRLIELCVRQLSGALKVGSAMDGGRDVLLDIPWPGRAIA